MVVTAIGDHPVRSLARPTAFGRDRADPVDQWEPLRDVIAMATGRGCGQRPAVTLDANTPFLEKDFIITRAHRCARERGQPVNLIAVDHYDQGQA